MAKKAKGTSWLGEFGSIFVPEKSGPITVEKARAIHAARSDRSKKADDCKINKRMLKRPTKAWADNPGGSDVPGIDAPGRCRTLKDGTQVCIMPPSASLPKRCTTPKKKSKKKK